MNNIVLLLGYLGLFYAVVSSYPSYKENLFAVALAAAVILISGLAAWVISIRGSAKD